MNYFIDVIKYCNPSLEFDDKAGKDIVSDIIHQVKSKLNNYPEYNDDEDWMYLAKFLLKNNVYPDLPLTKVVKL